MDPTNDRLAEARRFEDDARRAVDEALADHPQQVEAPPPLLITGLVVQVRPSNFAGVPVVTVSVVNQIASAVCAVPLEAVDQLIAQLEEARAQASGLAVERARLVVPGQ